LITSDKPSLQVASLRRIKQRWRPKSPLLAQAAMSISAAIRKG
jgi:hypothetical protein